MATQALWKGISTRSCHRLQLRRLFATQPASADVHQQAPSRQPAKISKLSNGMVIATADDNLPVTKASVVLKAGSRYETGTNRGVAHCLRLAAELTNQESSAFGMCKNLGHMGAEMSVTCTRDYMIYSVECLRENIDGALRYVADITTQQAFLPWEMPIVERSMKLDKAIYDSRPDIQCMELLHEAAYRNKSLGLSLYAPDYMVGHYSPDMLREFCEQHFTQERMMIAGSSIPHELLMEMGQLLFKPRTGTGAATVAAKYHGGEVRRQTGCDCVHAAIAAEGAGLKNTADHVALSLLAKVIGGPSTVHYGVPANKLWEAVNKITDRPFAVTAMVRSYSDSGLFGVYVMGYANHMDKIMKTVYTHMGDVAKSGITDKQLEVAKHQLKADSAMAMEDTRNLLESMSLQAMINGELQSYDDLSKVIDSITAAKLSEVAKKVMAGKLSMSAVGNLENTPYLDQLR